MAKIISPPPDRDAGQWADALRVLPPESPEPGPWRTDRVPFWRDIYRAFADERHDTIVIVCGAQMSKTESLMNLIGQRFTDGPYVPAIYVGPTEKQVRSMSKDRFDKMLRSTPVLWERTEKGHRYGSFEKFIAGVRLGFAWAGSATELSSHPAGLIVVDERDRMDASTGDEGDPVSLARARTKNYANRKIVIVSTPTLEGASPIWALWEEGTQQMWAWPCLHCGKFFVPQLSLLTWQKKHADGRDMTAEESAATAVVACQHCGSVHHSRDKPRLNVLGTYLPHRRLTDRERAEQTVLGHYVQAPAVADIATASFWISGLASPWASFEQIARVLINAYRSAEPERIQAEVNTWGGELFRLKGDAPSWEEVGACRGEYRAGTVVPGVQKLTLGADVQRDGIYYVIRGWGFNSESWLIEHGYLAGETEHDAVWIALRNVLQTPIRDRRIDRAFIDSGYRPGDVHRRPDHAVYTFCRSLPGLAYPTKGQDTMDTPFLFRAIDYTAGGTLIKGGVKLCHLNTDYLKRWLHARVRWPAGQSGAWHLHMETDEDYCRQMVSEELVLKPSGRAVWVRRSRQNHYLDAEVNATGAAYSINVHKLLMVTPDAPPSQPVKHGGVSPNNPAGGSYGRRQLY
jgi:phage terminase large subunit GpA-like protein